MLNKFGINKFLKLSIMLMIIGTVVMAGSLVYFTQRNLKFTLVNTKSTSETHQQFTNLVIHLSSIHGDISTLLTVSDPDVLEKRLERINKDSVAISAESKSCRGDCTKLSQSIEKYFEQMKSLIETKIMLGKNAEAIEFYIQNLSPSYQEILDNCHNLNLRNKNDTSLFFSEIERKATVLRYTIIFAGIAIVIITIIGGIYLRTALMNALHDINEKLENSAKRLHKTANKVEATSDILTEATEEQNSSIAFITQALEEITEMTKLSMQNISYSSSSAKDANKQIIEGRISIKEMLQTIEAVEDSNRKIIQQLEHNDKEMFSVVDLIKNIDEKTKIINDIVFQTKLLSFNASVEAARAGEHGKGFSVVAEEVGKLAIMSGQASNDISHLLNDSINRVNEIASKSQESMQALLKESNTTINLSMKSSENCYKVFDQVDTEATKIFKFLEQIEQGAHEQTKAVEEVDQSMHLLNNSAKKNDEVSHSSLEMSHQLANQSTEIEDIIERMKKIIDGDK